MADPTVKLYTKLHHALVSNGTCENLNDAEIEIQSMAVQVLDGINPEEVLDDYCLEPDYVFDILDRCV